MYCRHSIIFFSTSANKVISTINAKLHPSVTASKTTITTPTSDGIIRPMFEKLNLQRAAGPIHRHLGGYSEESSKHQHIGLNLHSNWQKQRHCLVTDPLPFPYYVAGGLDGTCLTPTCRSEEGKPPKLTSAGCNDLKSALSAVCIFMCFFLKW